MPEPDEAAFAFGCSEESLPIGFDGRQKFGRARCLRVGQDFPKCADEAGRFLLRFGIEEGLRFRIVVVACGVNGMLVGIEPVGEQGADGGKGNEFFLVFHIGFYEEGRLKIFQTTFDSV